MSVPVRFAWCFSHGYLHDFGQLSPWCSATWVPIAAENQARATEIKERIFGNVKFLDGLTREMQIDIINGNDVTEYSKAVLSQTFYCVCGSGAGKLAACPKADARDREQTLKYEACPRQSDPEWIVSLEKAEADLAKKRLRGFLAQ